MTKITNQLVFFQQVLDNLAVLDFEMKAKPHVPKNSKIRLSTYRLIVVEELLEITQSQGYDFCIDNNVVYFFNSEVWAKVERKQLETFLSQAAERTGLSKFTAREYEFKEKLCRQFVSSLQTPKRTDNVLINLANGTYEITKERHCLRAFDRADFLTYQLPFESDVNASCPIFQAYLNKVLPDVSSQHVLAEYLGYIFTGMKLEKTLLLYGSGANGKSVFFEIVNAMLGRENVSNYSLQSLTNPTGYCRAKLNESIVNYASELTGNLDTTIFKQLASGEPVEARLPYGIPFILTNYARLIFNCNELPRNVEHNNAFFRRFLIVPFNVTIPQAEQDKELHLKIIANELPGVFNWVLAGLDRLLQQGKFTECAAAEQEIELYRVESNSVLMFLQECNYQVDDTHANTLAELYRRYRSYCETNGLNPFKKLNFRKQLQAEGYTVRNGTDNKVVVNAYSPVETNLPF